MTADQFAWWLVGLVDGEGHFGITKATHRPSPFYRCVFRVTLASRDRGLLEFAAERTGWGRIYEYAAAAENASDYTVWTVTTKQVGEVASFFAQHPLVSAKAADQAIWAPAARAQVARTQHGPRNEDAAAIMESAYHEMRTLRASRKAVKA